MNRRLEITCAALTAIALMGALALPASAADRGRDRPGRPSPAVDLALGAAATATSERPDAPASGAVDGSASTAWCPTGKEGTVVVDLGREHTLDELGITLAAANGPATMSAAVRGATGRWRPVGDGGMAISTGVPVYLTLDRAEARARYARLSVSAPTCVAELRLLGPDPATTRMALGGDLSFESQELAAGAVFTDLDGRTATPTSILRAHGANYVRLRLWVNPPPGYSDLASDLTMARRVKRAGMKLYLDLHYSDFWADPQHQVTPLAWQGQDLPTLVSTVRDYTRQVLSAFAAQGTPVDMVSIGNEIRNGLLWPTGQIDWTANTGWSNLGALLKAGADGARAGNPPDHRLRIMLHFDQGGDNAWSRRFFDNLVAQGVPFDVIGLSYYPFWHGPLTALRANVDDLATRYGRDVVIAETQYPWTLANGDGTANFVWQQSQLPAGYPASPEGQLSFVNDLLSILAGAPDGHGAGLFYWEPEWIPGVGWEPGAGTPNDNLTLFDFPGHALPSIALFQSPSHG